MAEDHFLNLQPGTIVNGRYEIVKCLGAGSMGMVYVCRHRELAGHLVAMKVLFSETARNSVAAARFRNEIVASYGVSHPNVVRAYEYFRDGDLIAFTMEYINGGDLAQRIGEDEPLSIDDIIRMLCQICSGVQAIHDAGIIHRDLKPENIMLSTTGDVKISDFGIARTQTGPKLTEHGGVVGTIDYVSPEYIEINQVDARSDVYSLGVISYEMLTGEPPYKGKSVIETMTMRLKQDAKPPHLLRQDCPEALSKIVLKAMERDPEVRYQSASEMLRDLEALRNGQEPTFETERKTPAVPANKKDNKPAVASNARIVSTGGRPSVRQSQQRGNGHASQRSYGSVEPMQAMLQRGVPMSPPAGTFEQAPSIEVSQGHLSAERIRKLSSDFAPNDGFWKSLLIMMLVLVMGFAVGLFLLTRMTGGDTMEPLGMNAELLERR